MGFYPSLMKFYKDETPMILLLQTRMRLPWAFHPTLI